MNLYPDRIEELHTHLELKYGHRDRQATEILLVCLLDPALTRMRRPSIIIETDYPSRSFEDAWFAFGGVVQPLGMFDPRTQRDMRSGDLICQGWLDRMTREPMLMADAEWRRYRVTFRRADADWMVCPSYASLQAATLKLRVEHPRGPHAMRLDRSSDREELARLTRRVLDSDQRRQAARIANSDRTPLSLLYWCELVQKLAVRQRDWEALTGGLAAVARGISVLYNDGREYDWAAADRVLRDCIPHVTMSLMREADTALGLSAWKYHKASGLNWELVVMTEVRRLVREGAMVRVPGPHKTSRWKLASQDWHELIDREKLILV